MNTPSNPPTAHHTMEAGIKDILCNAREGIRIQHAKCENRVRESPGCAILGAIAAGYLLHRLPMGAILHTHVRIVSALAPPALVLFGAAKLYDFLQRRETRDLMQTRPVDVDADE